MGAVLTEEGKRLAPGDPVREGQVIELRFPGEPLGVGLIPADKAADLLFLNKQKNFSLFFKERGVSTVPLRPWVKDCFANQVAARLEQEGLMSALSFSLLAEAPLLEGGLLQRLDKDTSGLVSVALTREAKALFRDEFSGGRVEKEYLALVEGSCPPGEGAFHLSAQGKERVRARPGEGAALRWELLAKSETHSLLKIKTADGQRHVVRACLASLGFPLAGDLLYGASEGYGLKGHMLHASSLYFTSSQIRERFALPERFFVSPPSGFLLSLKACGVEFKHEAYGASGS